MVRTHLSTSAIFSLTDISEYHLDAERALHLYFSPLAPDYAVRFFGYQPSSVRIELDSRLAETDLRSALAVLTRLEAAFRTDYDLRCNRRKRDSISRNFRELRKTRDSRVGLETEIFDVWREHMPELRSLISDLRGAFKFRHWLAHGRYWVPKLGRRYDYNDIYTLATIVLGRFPLYVPNA
jgi:hypothetical protein